MGAYTEDMTLMTHLERQSTVRSDQFRRQYIHEAQSRAQAEELSVEYGPLTFRA
jgi:hypothetical protein